MRTVPELDKPDRKPDDGYWLAITLNLFAVLILLGAISIITVLAEESRIDIESLYKESDSQFKVAPSPPQSTAKTYF